MGDLSGIDESMTKKICLVDGRLYFYDVCDKEKRYHKRPDMVYIGEGVIFSIDGVVQKMGDSYLHFYNYDKEDNYE